LVFLPCRQWSDKIESSLEALQQEKAEKETQLAESQRDCEHLHNALAAERSALASQRSQRESDVAMLVRQVTTLQQQLQRAEDIKNQALRSADERSQREDHLIREVSLPSPFFRLTRY
jgi:flagellar motility protein MotE (MotC chaperone)